MKRIPDGSVDMILCDLPYGTTQNNWDSTIDLELLWQQYERVAKKNGAIVLTSAQPFTSRLIISNLEMFKYQWIWNKAQVTGFLNAKRQPLRQHEDICVFYKNQCTYNPEMIKGEKQLKATGSKSNNYGKYTYKPHISEWYYPKSILNFPQQRIEGGHPTQKPVELFKYLIRTYTNEGETVLDNCMGSGTTAIACMDTNRNYIGFELDETYYKKSLERIKNHATQTELFDYI